MHQMFKKFLKKKRNIFFSFRVCMLDETTLNEIKSDVHYYVLKNQYIFKHTPLNDRLTRIIIIYFTRCTAAVYALICAI